MCKYNRKSKLMGGLLTVVSVLFLLMSGAAYAGTPDGITPADETVCDGLSGKLFGICNAYCEAMDCHLRLTGDGCPSASEQACDRLRLKFVRFGGEFLPCDPIPSVRIIKLTNRVAVADGPAMLLVGTTVNWTYDVSNTGAGRLDVVEVTDVQDKPIPPALEVVPVLVDCEEKTSLEQGGFMTCTASATVVRGTYTNTATVTADALVDTSISSYIGLEPEITIKKRIQLASGTEPLDADEAPGPDVNLGDPITIFYEVTNTGDVPLFDVTIQDQTLLPIVGVPGVPGNCTTIEVLEKGETAPACLDNLFAQPAGQHQNLATVTAVISTELGDVTVTDTDPVHFNVVAPPVPPPTVCPCADFWLNDDIPGSIQEIKDSPFFITVTGFGLVAFPPLYKCEWFLPQTVFTFLIEGIDVDNDEVLFRCSKRQSGLAISSINTERFSEEVALDVVKLCAQFLTGFKCNDGF